MLSLTDFRNVLDEVFGCCNVEYKEDVYRPSSINSGLMYAYNLYAYYKGKPVARYHCDIDMKPKILVYSQRKNEYDYKTKHKFTFKRALIKANYTELHERDVLWEIDQKTSKLISKHFSSMYDDYIKVFSSMLRKWDDKWLVQFIEELNKIHEERVKHDEAK